MKGKVYIRGKSPIDCYGINDNGKEYVLKKKETYVRYYEKPPSNPGFNEYEMTSIQREFLAIHREKLQEAIAHGEYYIVF